MVEGVVFREGVQAVCSVEEFTLDSSASRLERETQSVVEGKVGKCTEDVEGRRSDGVEKNWPAISDLGWECGEVAVTCWN